MPFDDATEKSWKFTRFLAFVTLIFSPIVYLVVTQFVETGERGGGETDMMLYILLLVAIVTPSTASLIERFQLAAYKRGTIKGNAGALFQTVSIIKFALVEAAYIFGLAMFFITGDINLTLYFYPIGMIWTIVIWPRRSKFEDFIQRAQLPWD